MKNNKKVFGKKAIKLARKQKKSNQKKFEIVGFGETWRGIDCYGYTKDFVLYRIKAVKSFKHGNLRIRKGELGGLVETAKNLSHKGTCWITKDSKVYGGAQVLENAFVSGYSDIAENSKVYGNSGVHDSKVYGESEVFENALVDECSEIRCYSKVYGNALVSLESTVIDSQISGNVKIINSQVDEVCFYENELISGEQE